MKLAIAEGKKLGVGRFSYYEDWITHKYYNFKKTPAQVKQKVHGSTSGI